MPSVIGSGYSVAAPVPPAGVLDLLDAPNGGYLTHIQQPRTVSYNGYTYAGFVDGSGRVKVTAVNESTGLVVSTTTLHTYASVDTHDTPAIWIRASDHKLLAVYSGHNSAEIYKRISTTSLTTDPDIGDGFATETGLHSQLASWATYTYPILLQLMDETSDPIYLFWRERHTVDRLRFSTSTDGGTTWATSKPIAIGDTTGQSTTYWNIGTDGLTRFDVFWCDYSDGDPSQMHHFYYDGGSYFKSDDTLIRTQAAITANNALSLVKSEMTLVLDNSAGAVDRCLGVAWEGTVASALGWQRNGSADNRVVSCRYRTGAWQTDTVINSVGGIVAGNLYISGCDVVADDPDIVYLPRLISGVWEMYRYVSADDGATWTPTALTSGSAGDNLHPATVVDASAAIAAVWSYGVYTDFDDFSLGLRATEP